MTDRTRTFIILSAAAAIAVTMVIFREPMANGSSWHPWNTPGAQRDLDERSSDTLHVLLLRDPLVWEERPRATTGLELELLQRFAKRMKLKLTVLPFDPPDSLLQALWQGRGDVAGAQLAERKEWKGYLNATLPYMTVAPMVVRLRNTKNDSSTRPDRPRVTAYASPFFSTTVSRSRNEEPYDGTEDDALVNVLLEKVTAATVSDLRAGHEAARFPILEFLDERGEKRDLCFAVRASSPRLLAALNDWLADKHEAEARQHLIAAYTDRIPQPGPFREKRAKGLRRDSISPFDRHFREHAAVRGCRWELLAAMAWKETRFDSTVTSHKGAMGIMQFMPATAAHLGLDSSSTMEDHIQAAAGYLNRLDTIWLRAVPDKEQRLRFVLASYNAGPGHIIDAQRLASQLGLDPSRWEGHVERAVLLLAKPRFFMRPEMKNGYCKGSQVFHYVRGVLAVYEQLLGKRDH